SALLAVVTTDSGFEYGTIEETGHDMLMVHMKLNKGNIRAPSMRFAGRQGLKVNFDFLDPHLKFAPSYGVAVAGLTHNDYVMHGALRPALMPEKWPGRKGAKRTSDDRLCRPIMLVIGANLK